MKFRNYMVACGLALAISSTSTLGSETTPICVDEYGHILINYLPAAPGIVAQDPFSGQFTLRYTLPFMGVAGDIVLLEPPSPTNPNPGLSDRLRFDGQGHLFFFSDFDPNEPPEPGNLAEFGLIPPNHPLLPVLTFMETGVFGFPYSEAGPNGLENYIAVGTAIGGDPTFNYIPEYCFISDGVVPEPTSLALAVMGGAMLFASRRRK